MRRSSTLFLTQHEKAMTNRKRAKILNPLMRFISLLFRTRITQAWTTKLVLVAAIVVDYPSVPKEPKAVRKDDNDAEHDGNQACGRAEQLLHL
jgi:hypothetical protein